MRRSVRNALEHWRGEGLLTEEQIAVLAASAESAQRRQDSARAVMVFGVIGAVLTGLGAILFVACNWAFISPLQRTLMLLAGYGIVPPRPTGRPASHSPAMRSTSRRSRRTSSRKARVARSSRRGARTCWRGSR